MSGEFRFVTVGENQGGEIEVAKSHCEGKERACPLCSHLGEKVKKPFSGKSGVTPNVVTFFIKTLEVNKLLKLNCPILWIGGSMQNCTRQMEPQCYAIRGTNKEDFTRGFMILSSLAMAIARYMWPWVPLAVVLGGASLVVKLF